MTGYLDKLNLRPFEKRLVVGVAAALFVAVNLVFVFPHFSDWGRMKIRMAKAQKTLATFKTEIGEIRRYQADVKKMETEGGQDVPPEDQVVQFSRTIQDQAIKSDVHMSGLRPQTRTNDQFFIEQYATITLDSPEPPLVDFLYNLGVGSSLVRVRDLTLRPDQPKQKLNATITLVASYQKKAAPRAVAPAEKTTTKSTAPTPKPSGPLGKNIPANPKATSPTGAKSSASTNQPRTQPPKRQ
jgi:hypothetical protein